MEERSNLIISKEVQAAINEFRLVVRYEKELSTDPMIEHMEDYALKQTLMSILEEKPDRELVEYLERAAQSFKSQRRQTSTNPIRIFTRHPHY